VHVLKSFSEVLAGVVVKAEVRIVVGDAWVIAAEQLFRDYDALRLKLDCLKEIPNLELYVGHLGNALGDVRIHCSCDLEEQVDGLAVKVEGLIPLLLLHG
jgi:hypothetical protein